MFARIRVWTDVLTIQREAFSPPGGLFFHISSILRDLRGGDRSKALQLWLLKDNSLESKGLFLEVLQYKTNQNALQGEIKSLAEAKGSEM